MLSYIITYGLMLFSYLLFFMALYTSMKSNSGKLKDVLSGKGETDIFLSQLIAGIFFLGIAAAVIFEKRELDITIIGFASYGNNAIWIFSIAAIIIGIFSAYKVPGGHVTAHSLPPHLPFSFVLTRTLFLIVYEFFFRGVMLFIMIEDMGIILAIIINLFFYVFVHWFDKKERYGSLLMGIVLCGITFYTHSIWPAILIHLSLALSYEISLLVKYKSSFKKSLI